MGVSIEDDGTATVTLRNGNLYRGALVERVPGDHVTLRMASGEVKLFSWGDLAPAEAPAPAPIVVAPPLANLEAPGVLVTLAGGDGVHLERVTGTETGGAWGGSGWGGSGWGGSGRGTVNVLYGAVCEAPCNVRVDSSYVYRVAGPGYTSTRTFQISGDAVRIDAHMGSMAQRVFGWVLLGAGLGVGTVGVVGGLLCNGLRTCTTPAGWYVAGAAPN